MAHVPHLPTHFTTLQSVQKQLYCNWTPMRCFLNSRLYHNIVFCLLGVTLLNGMQQSTTVGVTAGCMG